MGQARLGAIGPWGSPSEWQNRPMYEPGTHFKYNDVRVNVLALAALQVWRRPLPEVLRDEIMEPIGASSTWRWYGYENSWVDIDGTEGAVGVRRRPLGRRHVHQRVGHGAVRLSVPAQWQMERSPDRLREVDPDGADTRAGEQGLWLRELVPQHRPQADALAAGVERARSSAPATTSIYIDWDNDLVVVVRWIKDDKSQNEFFGKVLARDERPRLDPVNL